MLRKNNGSNRRQSSSRLGLPGLRLQAKIVMALIGVVVVVMGGTGVVIYHFSYTSAHEELELSCRRVATRLSDALPLPMWSYDLEACADAVQAEMLNSDIIAIAVYQGNTDKDLWFAFRRRSNGEIEHIVSQPKTMRPDASAEIAPNTFGSISRAIAYNERDLGRVVVHYTDAGVQKELQEQLTFIGFVTLFMGIGLAVVMSILLSYLIVQPIRSVVDRLHDATRGDYIPVDIPQRNDEITLLAATFDEMTKSVASREHQLQSALSEKEVLLKEVHHRVKNNFQILASLLSLQMNHSTANPEKALLESYNRILSMALVHEKLHESDSLQNIDFPRYLRELVEVLRSSYGMGHVDVSLYADTIDVGLDTAVPLGLILNEAISNAFKHAYSSSQQGNRLTIQVVRDRNTATIHVADDGSGLPEGFAPKRSSSLGIRLIEMLTDQLGGTYRLENRGGTVVSIQFPLP